MHSKRGRKINQSRPSTRAQQNSRAFRARQAAHRQALEQRVLELEAENDCFRQIYGYPPSSRPLLGRGPTGLQFPPACSRDVIATLVTEPGGRTDSQLLLNHQSPMPGSNFTQSRSSTSGPSLQSGPFLPTDPSTCSRDVQVMEPSGRNDSQSMLLNHQSHSPTSCPTLQSPSLPTDPSTCSHDVPATEPRDWDGSQLMFLNQQSCSSTSGPSLHCPSLPTHPKTRSHDVPVTEPSGRNDPQLMLSSHWSPIARDVYLSSPNPDGPIDGLSGGRDTDEIYTHRYHQHNADMNSQNHPTLPEFVNLWYYF